MSNDHSQGAANNSHEAVNDKSAAFDLATILSSEMSITSSDIHWYRISDNMKRFNNTRNYNAFSHLWIVDKDTLSEITMDDYCYRYNDNVYITVYAFRIADSNEWFFNVHCWVGNCAIKEEVDVGLKMCAEFAKFIRRTTIHFYLEYSGYESSLYTSYSVNFIVANGSYKTAQRENEVIAKYLKEKNEQTKSDQATLNENQDLNQSQDPNTIIKDPRDAGSWSEMSLNNLTNPEDEENQFMKRLYRISKVKDVINGGYGVYLYQISEPNLDNSPNCQSNPDDELIPKDLNPVSEDQTQKSDNNNLNSNYTYIYDKGIAIEIIFGKNANMWLFNYAYLTAKQMRKLRNLPNKITKSFNLTDSVPLIKQDAVYTYYRVKINKNERDFELLTKEELKPGHKFDEKDIILIDVFNQLKHHIMIRVGERTNLNCAMYEIIKSFDDVAKFYMKKIIGENAIRSYSYSFTNELSNSPFWDNCMKRKIK